MNEKNMKKFMEKLKIRKSLAKVCKIKIGFTG